MNSSIFGNLLALQRDQDLRHSLIPIVQMPEQGSSPNSSNSETIHQSTGPPP